MHAGRKFEISHRALINESIFRDFIVTTFPTKMMLMVVFLSAPRTKYYWLILVMEAHGAALKGILGSGPFALELLTQVKITV